MVGSRRAVTCRVTLVVRCYRSARPFFTAQHNQQPQNGMSLRGAGLSLEGALMGVFNEYLRLRARKGEQPTALKL